ncbi:MAG TPA: NAD(+) synthase [Polyangiaceae bacterium]|jgi:NAD+ synthase (glutamine-hydrolysing)|nr:NAD(+) synthase [Polyangiaceae bacterium]
MRLVRIALANVNSTVGACRSNVDRAIALVRAAAADGATVVVLPEQIVGGYPPEDLVQWRAFVDSQRTELARFTRETAPLGCVCAVGLIVARGANLYNVAALVHAGRVWGFVPKEKLPLYNVFYEARTLARGTPGLHDTVDGVPFGDLVFDLDFGTVALEVCEDGWSPDGPMRRRSYAGAELVLNLSASPFRLGITDTRREMMATRAADCQATVAYVNAVGANDGLVFDGGGYVAQNGRLVLSAKRFREGVEAVTVDLDRTRRLRTENTTWRDDQAAFAVLAPQVTRVPVDGPTRNRETLIFPAPANKNFFLPASPPQALPPPPIDARDAFCEELLDALAMGLGDYFEKTGAFKTIGVALSGGRDSLLVLAIARRWIDQRWADRPDEERRAKAREILRAFFLPTRFSSPETRAAAERAAKDLDTPFVVVPIEDAFERELVAVEKMLQPGESLTPLARQNVQARVRAERMWTWANAAQGLFLQTSNMSEKAVGYVTIGGDGEGALSVVANVPKTVVNYVLDWLYEKTRWEGIRLTLLKPATAELAENQEDERELMPFPVLDACFALFAGEKMSPGEVAVALKAVFPEHPPERLDDWAARFVRLFTASIYKWVQAPISIHVGNLDLERERALQLPVVQRSEWHKA